MNDPNAPKGTPSKYQHELQFPTLVHAQNEYLLRSRSSKWGFFKALRTHEKKQERDCLSLTLTMAAAISSDPPTAASLGNKVRGALPQPPSSAASSGSRAAKSSEATRNEPALN